MKVYFIGAGPGDPDLITVKGSAIIGQCGYCIYAGSLVSEKILHYCPAGVRLYNSAKMTLEEVLTVIEEAQARDTDVARIHTGDPSVFGAIQEQIVLLEERGIEFEIIPGVSSFSAAAAALQQQLTLPGVSQTVILTRKGNRTHVPPAEDLRHLAKSQGTLCIFLSITELDKVVEDLRPEYGDDCPVAIVYRASWEDQEIVRSTLSKVVEDTKNKGITRQALIIVGHALSREGLRSKLYDGKFSHLCRKEQT